MGKDGLILFTPASKVPSMWGYHFGRMISLILLAGLLTACTASYDYRTIDPKWTVAHSPVPVPLPQEKPQPPQQVKKASPPRAVPVSVVQKGDLTVRKGDSVYGLARANGVEVRDLIAANKLRAPYTLYPGDRLVLPNSRFHTIQKGETGYSISRTYNVDVAALMRMNNIKPPYKLSVGQRLRLPLQSQTQPVHSAQPGRKNVHNPKTTPQAVSNTGPVDVHPASQVSKTGFQWPVEGQILSRFGPKQNGLHNDGINIAAKQGTHVRAARDGIVAYAGNGFKGFGNILLIRHDGGWITAYAHNERLLVGKGQAVRRGQVIARVGTSGSINTPQLHFEIRKERAALNPETQLPELVS